MPTDTFMKLSEEKKERVISAAKEEFARANLSEASIKNIAEKAGIARRKFLSIF